MEAKQCIGSVTLSTTYGSYGTQFEMFLLNFDPDKYIKYNTLTGAADYMFNSIENEYDVIRNLYKPGDPHLAVFDKAW